MISNCQDKETVSLSPKVAFILPRYGASIGGGAETLCRDLMLRAKALGIFSELEVWTTCALDHRTWKNELPEACSEEDGIKVHRFSVDERDVEVFLQKEIAISEGRKLETSELLDWMANSVNSKALYEHIERNHSDFDYLFFAPYLFATTFWGSLIAPEKSVLIPCLHDEPYALQKIFEVMFNKVSGLMFNTGAEKDLMMELYGNEALENKSFVVGMGFENPGLSVSGPSSDVLKRISTDTKYFIYAGRKEEGKNLDLLINYFENFIGRFDCKLVLIGSGEIGFRETLPENVVDLGFVSEEDKLSLIAGAEALIQPSVNESFSIVMMEAWLQETPVISHALCEVTRQHVVDSGGGLYFANPVEFTKVVQLLLEEPETRRKMALAGKAYVEKVYSWEAVLGRFQDGLAKLESLGEKNVSTEVEQAGSVPSDAGSSNSEASSAILPSSRV